MNLTKSGAEASFFVFLDILAPSCYNTNVVRLTSGKEVRFLSEVKRKTGTPNTDEQKVLAARFFSSYKGVPCVKLPIGTDAFSFGFLFIGRKNTDPTVIRHEYGHFLQLKEKGFFRYIREVAIPSVTCYRLDKKRALPFSYYGSPWEREADLAGGVNRNDALWPMYAPSSDPACRRFIYHYRRSVMDFRKWMEKQVPHISPDMIAFNFNLYEEEQDGKYSVELVGCREYDKDNEDWACSPDYSSGERNLFAFSADEWEDALELCIQLVKDYLRVCPADDPFTRAAYITAGFVDGDLEVIRG